MKSFNPDGTLTEEGKKAWKETKRRKATASRKSNRKGISTGIRRSRKRRFNFYEEMEEKE